MSQAASGSELESDIFSFIVGEGDGQKTINVHVAVIAGLSDNLHGLCHGPMKESAEKTVRFPKMHPDTFARVCQFAYWRDYKEALPIIEALPEEDVSSEAPQEADADIAQDDEPPQPAKFADGQDDMFGYYPSLKKKKRDKRKLAANRAVQWDDLSNDLGFDDLEFDNLPTPRSFDIRSAFELNENYTPVFLSHASIYAFAVKWEVQTLKKLSLYKLHSHLCTCTLSHGRAEDVISLAAFIYGHDTEGVPVVPDPDDLQSLVIKYLVQNRTSFTSSEALRIELENGGAFARDLGLALLQT